MPYPKHAVYPHSRPQHNGNIVENLKYYSAWCNFLCAEAGVRKFFLKLHVFRGVDQSELRVKSKRNYYKAPLWAYRDAAEARTRLPKHAVVGR
jgi:hypothetical protein